MLEENKIHLGDCLDLMPSISSKSVDMILCDLPYGNTKYKWDSAIDLSRLWQEYERIIKDDGAIVLTANGPFSFVLHASNPSLFRYKWIWVKSKKTRFLDANWRPLIQHEDILVFCKRTKSKYNPQKIPKEDQSKRMIFKPENRYGGYGGHKSMYVEASTMWFPTDVLEFSNEIGFHPTQKPVALFEYLIKTYTNEGELVLDNCSGSGTTAIACMNTNRRFICIERDETYHRKSIERMNNHEPLFHLGGKC